MLNDKLTVSHLDFCPPVVAHRGASAYAPENTIAAFTKAVQLGIKWVEFDVVLAACDEAIVFHDETLERTTNGQGYIGDYPYSFLHGLDAGAWFDPRFSGERIPSLVQMLDFVCATHVSANVEIKPLPGQDKKTVLQTLAVVREFLPYFNSSMLFSSFSVKALEVLRQQDASCLIGLLMDEWRPDWQTICDDLQCVSVHVNQAILTADIARTIKHTGRKLLCYTVNDLLRAKELYSWGVDAVFSDVPDKILL